jgi:hypothetical protein
MSKKINLIANIILPIVVIAIIIALFFMFKPKETTALFYFNLGYTILLEAVFFGYLNLLYAKVKEFSTPLLAVFGVYAVYYVIIGFVFMLVYSLILSPFLPIKFYIAALMILTLLWVILSVLTAQTDSNYKETVEKLKDDTHTLNFYTQKINLLTNRYEKLCVERGLKYETDSNNRTTLDRLKGKINFLTSNVLSSDTAVSQLTSLFNKCEDIIEETESATEDKLVEVQKKMQRFVDNAIAEIEMLKNITKR